MRNDVGTVRSASALDREHTNARSRTPYSGSPCSEPMRTTDPCSARMSRGLGAAADCGAAFVAKAPHPQRAMPTTVARDEQPHHVECAPATTGGQSHIHEGRRNSAAPAFASGHPNDASRFEYATALADTPKVAKFIALVGSVAVVVLMAGSGSAARVVGSCS